VPGDKRTIKGRDKMFWEVERRGRGGESMRKMAEIGYAVKTFKDVRRKGRKKGAN